MSHKNLSACVLRRKLVRFLVTLQQIAFVILVHALGTCMPLRQQWKRDSRYGWDQIGRPNAIMPTMMPGGHLATSIALSGVAYASTGSVEATAGCFAGGFLIDVDHYLDYLLFEKQWRRPGPRSFLRYYFKARPKRCVLPLHSAELMTVLFFVLSFHPWPLLVGYWFGAAMHLIFD